MGFVCFCILPTFLLLTQVHEIFNYKNEEQQMSGRDVSEEVVRSIFRRT